MPNTLAAHALSGHDTVGSYFEIGKPAVIKRSKNNTMSLASIGKVISSLQLCETERTNFILSYCKQKKLNSLTEVRGKVWKYHVSQNNTLAPKLESLLQQIRPSWKISRELKFK